MASIGRWLYRLVSICLPCLKPAETDETETKDNPSRVNPVEYAEENNQFKNEYPNDLNPFTTEEDGKNENLNGRPGKEQHEDEYPEDLNPFASDGEEIEGEIDYPEELNPFTDEKKYEQEINYPEELNPFAQEEDDEADPEIANQSSPALVHELNPPVKNVPSSTVSLLNIENTDSGKEECQQHEDEYPDSLNPFGSEDEEDDYPEELNPFAQEEKDEAAEVNQPSVALAPELTSGATNGSSSTFQLPNEERSNNNQKENVQQGNEYPESLNPFGSQDEEEDYPEELNPFAQEEKDETYSALVNQSSTTLSNELAAPPSNCSSSKFPLPNEEKLDNEQDESGQRGEEYPDFLNPFAIEDGETERHEDDYPDELNPFAHENQASSKIEDPLQTMLAIIDSSPTVPLANETKKAKSIKKYRAPVPPAMICILLKKESAPGVNESAPGVIESAPGVIESAPGVIESAPGVIESAPEVNESAPEVNESATGVNEPAPEVNEPAPEVNEPAPGDLETSGPVPLTVKVGDYDEALNPFASEDEETTGDTTGNLPSSPAQPIAPTAYNCTSVNVKRKKAKSLKKRRAPDPPVIASAKQGSATSDIIANQPPCVSSSGPGTTKA